MGLSQLRRATPTPNLIRAFLSSRIQVEMDDLETRIHSFVVKVWLEEPADERHCGVWRGHITHVASGRRVNVTNLSSVQSFVSRYLEEMGIRFGIQCRLQCWLDRLIDGRWRN
jgi:hypothetical protein